MSIGFDLPQQRLWSDGTSAKKRQIYTLVSNMADLPESGQSGAQDQLTDLMTTSANSEVTSAMLIAGALALYETRDFTDYAVVEAVYTAMTEAVSEQFRH